MNFSINHIKIENFRVFDTLETDLWWKTIVQSDNAVGKTSFASAILWCLTGKDVEGNSTFEIVPVGKYGEVSPSVELECKIDDRPVTLKREYKEKFSRDKSFSDYAVTTYINGIETGVRKFQEWISKNICDEQVFKILSNPKTFIEDCPKETKELIWQAQRRILLSIIGGNKTDLELAESDEKWYALVEPFKRYDNASQYLSYLKKLYSECQKALDSYDIRIEQQEKNLVNVKHTDEEIEQLVAVVKKQASDLVQQNESYKKSQRTGKASAIKDKIASLTKEKESILNKYNEDKEVYNRTKQAYQSQADSLKQKLEEYMKTLKTYAEAVDKLKATKVVEVCETCGQKLRPASIEASKKKLVERITLGQQKTAQLSNYVAELRKKWDESKNKVHSIMEPTYPIKADEISDQIISLMNQLSEIPEDIEMPGYSEKKNSLEGKMDSLKEEYILLKRNREVEEEIERIEAENKENVSKMSKIQRGLDLTKSFISFKCKSAEDSINSLFEDVTFQLFEKNKSNDEIKETCILRFRGIKYQDLSYSTKIIAALEVVRAFQKFYNVTVPVTLDNAESITGIVNTGAQTFFMKVKEELCPECGGESGRRNKSGTWTCNKCGHVWKKNLEIVEA